MKEPLPDSELAPEDLQSIFDNIDDYSAFWLVLYNGSFQAQTDNSTVSLAQVKEISNGLKMSSAPLYPSIDARGARALIYRLLNLAVKVFGSPQIIFNRHLRDYIGELQLTFEGFDHQAARLNAKIEALNSRILQLEDENDLYRQDIETLARQMEILRADTDRSEKGRRGENGS